MARAKKNNSLLHPIDTVMHWYTEAQEIPAQLKRKIAVERDKAVENIKKLNQRLNKAKDLQRNAKEKRVDAVFKVEENATKARRASLKKSISKYEAARHKAEQLAKEIKAAKNRLSQAQLKQKYYRALESAFLSVTKLFTKKHSSSVKKRKSHGKR